MKIALDTTQADCLRTVNNIGSNVVHNICTGEQFVVPWGSADWFGAVALYVIGTSVMAAVVLLVAMILRD